MWSKADRDKIWKRLERWYRKVPPFLQALSVNQVRGEELNRLDISLVTGTLSLLPVRYRRFKEVGEELWYYTESQYIEGLHFNLQYSMYGEVRNLALSRVLQEAPQLRSTVYTEDREFEPIFLPQGKALPDNVIYQEAQDRLLYFFTSLCKEPGRLVEVLEAIHQMFPEVYPLRGGGPRERNIKRIGRVYGSN